MRAVGPTDRAPLGINVALGTVSIAALWFVVRGWFGAPAAVGAAALLACNEFHIAMSRSGMTDVLFALLFLCGLPVAARALASPVGFNTLGAALLTAAAWNTKYMAGSRPLSPPPASPHGRSRPVGRGATTWRRSADWDSSRWSPLPATCRGS